MVQVPEMDTSKVTIIFDRPGIADSPYITPRGSIQGEFGMVYNKGYGLSEASLPAFLGRIPLSEKAELRVGLNYEPQSAQFIQQNFQLNKDPLAIGFKYLISRKRSIAFPEFAIAGNVFTPMQKIGKLETDLHGDFYLLMQHNFNKTHELNSNLGIAYFSNLASTSIPFSFCYNFNLNEKWTVFVEYFTYYFVKSEKWDSGWDTGIVWQFNDFMQVDVSWIQNLYFPENRNFVGLGFSLNTLAFGH